MIIVKIKAGLGNQMFQYACGRALALRNGDELKLDVSDWTLNREKVRDYLLPNFNIVAETAREEELNKLKYPWGKTVGKLVGKIRSKLGMVNAAFYERIFNLKGDVYLDGYWQSEKYFADFADDIRNDFTLRDRLGGAAEAIWTKIRNDDCSVSLQIRRGDNAHSPASMKTFGCPGLEYYYAAIKALTDRLEERGAFTGKINLYVFSDEIEWAKEHFQPGFLTTFVTRNDITLCEEMSLMRACRHNITSNSTFGWWGAWLNDYPDKVVVAPKQWALLKVENFRDLIPERWIKV